MKYKKSMILLLLAIFIFSIATVNAGDMNDTTSEGIMQMEPVTLKTTENEIITDNPNTFSQLDKDINASHDTFEMKYDYTFSNETDSGPVVIEKSNFTINGNNHVLDANMQSGIFNITGSNITINNLVFINGNSNKGGAIYVTGHITLNNVTFIGNNASCGGAILICDSILNCAGSRFIDNYGERGSSIYLDNATLKVSNSSVTSHSTGKYGQIYATDSSVSIDDSDFINITSAYASALYFEYCESSITNSRFINLTAEKSAGAIAVRWTGNSCIKGCEFINTKSIKNAGAIMVDYGMEAYNATVTECAFINSSSMIGGAYIQLGGRLLFNNTDFIDNKASCDGGAVYLSYAQGEFDNCNFNSNIAGYHSDYPALGGAVYSDKSALIIGDSNFINNSAYLGNAVYAWDSYYIIFGSTFLNNTNAIFTVFDYESSNLENNIYNNDTVVTNESYSYPTYVDSQALELKLINNTINASTLLERFDLRDWNLVSPVKNQGLMGSCWTFGMLSAVESALLKAYGLEFDLSEGNLHHNMLRYFIYGDTRIHEEGYFSAALSYLVGWYGPALEETDPYDEVGKLSPFITEGYDVIHIQDAVIVLNDEVPAGSKLKSAILKYGALAVAYYGDGNDANGYYNPKTSAHYINESLGINHAVSVIGWDDNFSKDNFLITPPGDGAWIVKNSWGTDWGDEGIVYISYYDKTFLPGGFFDCDAFGIVIENTIPYNKNYQHDFIWSGKFAGFDENGVLADDINVNGSIAYANQFEAASDDLIAAVGTYFNSSDVNYTVEIYVNDKLKLIQEGMSPFCGYHTIGLNEYVPVKKGDIFKAVITSNMMPYCYCPLCRVHFSENTSFFYNGYEWKDLYVTENIIACLKVYTVEDVDNIINYTFKDLNNHINWSGDVLEIIHDYTFSNETDNGPVVINKSNFTINGNNHVLDANMQSGIFNITGSNITINNLVFINGNSNKGGAIYVTGHITLNNVTFIGNNASCGGAILICDSILNCAGSRFIDNYGERGSSIYLDNATLKVSNSSVTSHSTGKYGQIYATDSSVSIDDSDFINITSAYASALYFEYCESSITNSRFINLTAEKSAGAIAVRWTGNSCIKGCEFINTKSIKNAGAIMVDYGMEAYNATVTECAFINSSSMIGGAYIQLGGSLILNGSNFTNNNAQVGGAVYISFTNTTIDNCIFESNKLSGNHYGGAVYCDISNLTLTRTEFLNNSAYLGNAVYACDSCYNITSCVFKNNANAIFTDFDKNNCILNNNEYINDSVITNQSFYSPVSFEYPGLNLTLIDNTISISTPPSRFDLRDWGWITPVKNQGRMGACWTFAFGEALETALLKATGIRYDVSENYIQNLQIRYSEFGDLESVEGGLDYMALANVVSWLSVGETDDEYDEVGKLSVFVESPNKIHLHDVLFIMSDAGNYVDEVKKAILNYGAVSIGYASSSEEPYFNENTSAQYTNESLPADHGVAIIGWDDNYSADNFLITPPGDGAWIVKNSWGTEWGDEGYFYLSYYEKSFFTPDVDTGCIYPFTACIFTNAIDYHVNYQTDLSGLKDFDANYTQYSNEFTSEYDDLIAAVGTYFNQSGINYSFDIYMNDKLVHSQSGVSEFAGYRTIVLSKYVSVKKGDKFKVVFKNNNLPYQAYSRQHYIQGMSFVSADGSTWKDITLENRTVCLKVYTVADDSKITANKDISVDYNGGKYFSVKVVTADGRIVVGSSVKFVFNGKTTTVNTDSNGIAKIKITQTPGKYTIKTVFNGKTYTNKVTVKQVLTASKVTVKKTAKKFTLKAKLKINGKLVKGKTVTFKFNGKTYKVKTNKKGIAQKTLKKNVIKKLKKGKTYTVKVTYLKDTIKTTVKVK